MLIGQSVFVPAGDETTLLLHGPWSPRQGDSGTAVLEIMNASATSGWSFKCHIETKNAEDSDSGAAALATMTAGAPGTHTGSFNGCLELVRYVFEISGGAADRWIHFRMNPPIWQPN